MSATVQMTVVPMDPTNAESDRKKTVITDIGAVKEVSKEAKTLKMDWTEVKEELPCFAQLPFLPCWLVASLRRKLLRLCKDRRVFASKSHLKVINKSCFSKKEEIIQICEIEKSEYCGGTIYTMKNKKTGEEIVLRNVDCVKKLEELWSQDAILALQSMTQETNDMEAAMK